MDAPRTDIITPYGAFPVILASLPMGLVWYHNMLSAPKMQGNYRGGDRISRGRKVEIRNVAPYGGINHCNRTTRIYRGYSYQWH